MTPRRIMHYPRRDGPLPAGVKWVGRPTKYGNPHDVKALGRAEAARRHRADFFAGRLEVSEADVLAELAGFEALACACPTDGTPCHADLYVELLAEQRRRQRAAESVD